MMINRKISDTDAIFNVVLYIVASIILITVLYPLIYIVSASFSDPTYVNSGQVYLFPKGFTIAGYKKIFEYSPIWTGYMNTIIYTVVGTLISVIVTTMGGYVLAKKDLPGKSILTVFIVFTMFFQGGLIPNYLLVKELNLINTIWAVILPNAVQVWYLLISKTYFQSSIPNELRDAGLVDGCTNIYFLYKIVMPLSKALIGVLALFYAVTSWNSFFTALLYLRDSEKYPLQLILRSILIDLNTTLDMEAEMDPETILAQQKLADLVRFGSIIIASLPLLIVYPFLQKYFVKGMMVGSVKG